MDFARRCVVTTRRLSLVRGSRAQGMDETDNPRGVCVQLTHMNPGKSNGPPSRRRKQLATYD